MGRQSKASISIMAVLVLALLNHWQPIYAGSMDHVPFSQIRSPGKPIQFAKDQPTLEQMLPRIDFPYSYPQPLPLKGMRVPGLSPKAIEMLGGNYFVVVNNTSYPDMAALYRDNRLRGKSNFVTADSIINPYFAFTNASLASAIEEHVIADLDLLLKAMLKVSLADYKQGDDEEVRNDVVANIAFLSVALKLLNPTFCLPEIDLAQKLIKADLETARLGQKARSAIFDQQVDCYPVFGWHNTSRQLANFFACREWISRMSYPVSDITFGTKQGKGNSFRRSVLLFRSLDLATIDGQPAWETWGKLNRFFGLLGQPLTKFQEETLLPVEYKSQLKAVPVELKVTLSHLAEPFFRTKLLLAIRKQKPVKLHAASIFELSGQDKVSDLVASFRLFPVIGDPEIDWLKAVAPQCPGNSSDTCPLGLFVLHARGAGQANNILVNNIWRLEPNLARVLSELDRSLVRRLPGGQVERIPNRRWQILSCLFKPVSDAAQTVLRTEPWMSRRLESALAAWVDSHLAIAQLNDDKGLKAPSFTSESGQKPDNQDQHHTGKLASYHYLEPCPEIFAQIGEEARKLSQELTALGYFPEKWRPCFADFIRFAERLEKIADNELKGKPLAGSDWKLLAYIDIFLQKIVVPTAGALTISGSSQDTVKSVTVGSGPPGLLYIVLTNGTRTTLGRGALYTYYEQIDSKQGQQPGIVELPWWTEKFDVMVPTR